MKKASVTPACDELPVSDFTQMLSGRIITVSPNQLTARPANQRP